VIDQVQETEGLTKTPEKQATCKSAVSEYVNSFDVLNHLLGAKIELALGEVIGVSKELSNMLADSIRFRNSKGHMPVGLTMQGLDFHIKTQAMLIKISLECDGKPIEAVIDTGLQLNIVSKKVYKSIIRRPIDKSAAISMSDANGGKGFLSGVVENIPLDFGTVRTRANIYIGAHVPFDLLLR
jgi:hypothetical protein